LPLKADIFSVEIDVCFVPIADVEGLPIRHIRFRGTRT
jgi:hypothetical protein